MPLDTTSLWRLVVGMSAERDREFDTGGTLGAACLRSLREGFAQSAARYARDVVLALGRWPIAPERVAVPR